MHWTIAAPFIDKSNIHTAKWLVPYVPGSYHTFDIVPRPQKLANWHHRHSQFTSVSEWLVYWEHGQQTLQAAKSGGVITVFPQLAAMIGTQAKLRGQRIPIVAWLFNVGTCSLGIRRWLAQTSLQDIDYFVVHTRREIEIYHQWLGIAKERFVFVPYQVPAIPITCSEDRTNPFIAVLGSAHRDFATLFTAVEQTKTPTVVVSGKRAIAGLSIPSHVTTLFDIQRHQCLEIAQKAIINVIPLHTHPNITAAGQVTLVEAMRMGRAIIASKCNGIEDYITHGENGWLVEPNSVDALAAAIQELWHNPELRDRLGQSAYDYATKYCSDEAAGQALAQILDQVANNKLHAVL
ncbi:glycosyltransferase family 4 protein [Calothrix sp. NIES-3974]|uniref:glycosyltransferase family 4 protein n=1 Tax=Calothrix sp. NIES-3974 TaxID=2005462 RepID=UPI000B61135A|nr:glycosyltransferase [Calothrix sp. NIES-3974]BAZ04844.1 hypothetical protein NIES3974_14870 [Calothrix sp. NIES-3974]